MLKQYEELAVLEQGDDGAVVSIRGQGGPCVVLGPAYLGHLGFVLKQAEPLLASLPRDERLTPVRLLCVEMRTLLRTYDETCNKFIGRPAQPRSLAQALEELAELRLALDAASQAATAAEAVAPKLAADDPHGT